MTHISNSLGTINPVAELCARARKLGIVTLVDAAQSAGPSPAGRAGHRLRFPRVLRPQNVRADRHRRAVRPAGTARSHAAVSGRRRDDSDRRLPQEHVEARAAPIRGRHAGHFRRRSACTPRWIISTPSAATTSAQHDQELGALRLRETCRAAKTSGSSARHIGRAGLVSFLLEGRSRPRRGDAGRPGGRGVARRASLHPTAHAQARRRIHRPREFLFLQHDRGNGPVRGSACGKSRNSSELEMTSVTISPQSTMQQVLDSAVTPSTGNR